MDTMEYYLSTEAFRDGNIDSFEKLLASGYDPICSDRSDGSETALWRAAEGGHEHMVTRVLACPSIDLAIHGSNAASIAAASGHTRIVHRLIADPRVKPTGAILLHAINRGMTSVVAALLLDPRCKPEAYNSESLQAAAWYDRTDIVKLLLDDGRVNPGDSSSSVVVAAATNGNMPIMELLLADPRIDPSANQNAALVASINHIDITKRLLLEVSVLRILHLSQFPKYTPILTMNVIMNAMSAMSGIMSAMSITA